MHTQFRYLYRVAILSMCLLPALSMLPGMVYATLPLISDDAGLVGKNTLQLELSNEYTHAKLEDITGRENEFSPIFTYGLFRQLDAVMIIPYTYSSFDDRTFSEVAHEFGGIFTEWKWQIYNQGLFSFAIKPTFGFPASVIKGNENLSSIESSLFLLGTLSLDRVLIHSDLGYYGLFDWATMPSPRWHFSVADEIELSSRWRFVSNFWTEFGGDVAQDNEEWSLIAGMVYTVQDHLDLDIGLEHTSGNVTRNISILAGATIVF